MVTLGIESSSVTASCALIEDGVLIGESFVNCGHTHSVTLVPIIDGLLKTVSKKSSDIDLISVAVGPGSFTGVRIGICTAKGIAAPEDIPCVGISSLEGVAYNVPHFDGVICAVMDARVSQVYNAIFKYNEKGTLERLCEDRVSTVPDLCEELSRLDDKILIIGDGTFLFEEYSKTNNKIIMSESGVRFARGFGVAKAGELLYNGDIKKFKQENLLPVYLRAPQAVREREKKKRL